MRVSSDAKSTFWKFKMAAAVDFWSYLGRQWRYLHQILYSDRHCHWNLTGPKITLWYKFMMLLILIKFRTLMQNYMPMAIRRLKPKSEEFQSGSNGLKPHSTELISSVLLFCCFRNDTLPDNCLWFYTTHWRYLVWSRKRKVKSK